MCVHAGGNVEEALWTGLACNMPFSHRKWQEANQKIQELQASQEERADHEQKIKVYASCQSVQLPILGRGGTALLSLTRLPAWRCAQWHVRMHADCLVDARPCAGSLEATVNAQVPQ